mmetsp:Transcript_3887/g.6558  ORF Transcript_3887/g.6558 Transcript_3887/m.6558 type:complete len:239 (+) Transcript_3887:997-1713(+)
MLLLAHLGQVLECGRMFCTFIHIHTNHALGTPRCQHPHHPHSYHACGACHYAARECQSFRIFVHNPSHRRSWVGLSGLRKPFITPSLQRNSCFCGRLLAPLPLMSHELITGAEEAVPPHECWGKVACEELVVPIVLPGTIVARDEVEQVAWNIIARVRIVGHKQTHVEPCPHKGKVVCKEHACCEKSYAQEDSLNWVLILGIRRPRCLICVVHFVDILVDLLVVQESMAEVYPCVIHN